MSGTAEEAILLAVMNEDEDKALEALRDFHPSELFTFHLQVLSLAELIADVQHERAVGR